MTSTQVVEMLVNVTSNSPFHDYTHLDAHNLSTNEIHSVVHFRNLIVFLHITVNLNLCFK